MKNATLKIGAICVAGAGAVFIVTSTGLGAVVRNGPLPATVPANNSEAFPAADVRLAATLAAQEIALIDAGGMEMNSAGLHLVFPSDAGDPDLKNPDLFPWPGDSTIRRWGFWPAEPKYHIAYHACDLDLGRFSSAVNVSFGSVVPTALFTYSTAVDSSTGAVSILAYANSGTLIALSRLLAPIRQISGQSTDWYGITRPLGSTETTMRIVLVADNRALLPLDISAAVAEFKQGQITDQTFLIANTLSTAEATDILGRLN